uniref:Uncharacterized protein n=1 Tax=Populus trichocarpa TaxID=3694 RepID=A0A2K1WT75_POPTR
MYLLARNSSLNVIYIYIYHVCATRKKKRSTSPIEESRNLFSFFNPSMVLYEFVGTSIVGVWMNKIRS